MRPVRLAGVLTFYAHVRAWIKARWDDPSVSPNTRKSSVEGIIPSVMAHVRSGVRGRPSDAVLRRALRRYGLRPPTWDGEIPAKEAEALAWLAKASKLVVDLADADALAPVLACMDKRVRGTKPLGPSTVKARRIALSSCLGYAVQPRKLLDANPVQGLRVRRTRTSERIDPHTVPSPEQAGRLLDAVKGLGDEGVHLSAFFAVMYWSGARPAEVRHLTRANCILPATGWGKLILSGSVPELSAAWTDDGSRFDPRELKHRADREARPVPIPPPLVAILRAHIARWGTTPDGRLFWDVRPNQAHPYITSARYLDVWALARTSAITAEETAVHLAKRPYDLRHGNASFLLGAGIAPPEVARRLGHSVAVLFNTYAHWLNGQEEAGNALADAALALLTSDQTTPNKPLTSENSGHGPHTGQTSPPAAA
ncbi:tyrosine-type recombinase/integrase [Actinocorallia aurea]